METNSLMVDSQECSIPLDFAESVFLLSCILLADNLSLSLSVSLSRQSRVGVGRAHRSIAQPAHNQGAQHNFE